ncbi:sensor histidine kinase [Pseudahrensia aquimaris]|uniref:histidine kinase n=1 Tax=Pseudahrensia aquimaris TaxID=744461 RepID=A0ABW3FDT7_9HYPH
MRTKGLSPKVEKAKRLPLRVGGGFVICSLGALSASAAAIAFLAPATETVALLAPLVPLTAMAFGSRSLVVASGVVSLTAMTVLHPFAGSVLAHPLAPYGAATLAATALAALNCNKRNSPVQEVHSNSSTVSNAYGQPLSAVLDVRGNVVEAFGGAADFANDVLDKLHGRGLLERMHLLDRVPFLNALASIDKTERATIDLRLRGPDEARSVWKSFRCELSASGDGSAIAVLIATGETNALKANLEAQTASNEKRLAAYDAMISTVSHKLRNSLTAVLGFGELLQGNETNAEVVRDCAETIAKAGSELSITVDALSEFARLRADDFQPQSQAVIWNKLFDALQERLADLTRSRGVALNTERLETLPDGLTDEDACQQILLHFTANAVRSAGEGQEVRLAARQFGSFGKFTIESDATPIAENVVRYLEGFNASEIADFADIALEFQVCKGLTEALGGSISCETSGVSGSKITVMLPLRLAKKTRAAEAVARSIKNVAPKSRIENQVDDEGEYCARLSA